MNTILESKYIAKKQVFTKLLIESRMLEITYSEAFILKFYKYINKSEDDYKWETRKMNLIIDAPFGAGKKANGKRIRKLIMA